MAGVLGLMPSFEAKESGIVQRMPRNPDTLILTRELITRIFPAVVRFRGSISLSLLTIHFRQRKGHRGSLSFLTLNREHTHMVFNDLPADGKT